MAQEDRGEEKANPFRPMARIPPMHRPDLEVLRSKDGASLPTLNTKSAIWHADVNLEDLSKQRPFLLILHARSRASFHTFTRSDYDATIIGYHYNSIKRSCPKDFLMLLDQENYGHVIEKKQTIPSDPTIWRDSAGFWVTETVGLHILQIQYQLLDFIFGSCNRILYDSPTADNPCVASVPWPILTKPPHSYLQQLLEAPYQNSSIEVFSRLQTIFSAKARATEDRLLLLQEDHEFFIEEVYEACKTSPPAVVGHRSNSTVFGPESWDFATRVVIPSTVRDFRFWTKAARLFNQLAAFVGRAGTIAPGRNTSQEHVRCYFQLSHCIPAAMDELLKRLPRPLLVVPSFDKHRSVVFDSDHSCLITWTPHAGMSLHKKLGYSRL